MCPIVRFEIEKGANWVFSHVLIWREKAYESRIVCRQKKKHLKLKMYFRAKKIIHYITSRTEYKYIQISDQREKDRFFRIISVTVYPYFQLPILERDLISSVFFVLIRIVDFRERERESNTMAKSVTPEAISTILSIPAPDSSSALPDIVVQVLDLKPTGNRYT